MTTMLATPSAERRTREPVRSRGTESRVGVWRLFSIARRFEITRRFHSRPVADLRASCPRAAASQSIAFPLARRLNTRINLSGRRPNGLHRNVAGQGTRLAELIAKTR